MGNDQKNSPQHVFGPVPSRRLGASLGIDVVRFKTCSYDCIYCQLGRTTDHCSQLAEAAVTPETVVEEVRARLASGPRPDWITFSGSGEPTLYPHLGALITGLRQFGVPIAVITNGSLLWREDVAAACASADMVSPTLVAGSEAAWKAVNRPHGSITFAQMADGLVGFRSRFRGQIWLEVMLVAGVNDSDDEVRRIAELTRRIRPERVQLNTVVRPPTESFARAVPKERLEAIAGLFTPRAEVVADAPREPAARPASAAGAKAGPDDVLALLRRHPSTIEDVAAGLNIPPADAERLIAGLARDGRITSIERAGRKYWQAGN